MTSQSKENAVDTRNRETIRILYESVYLVPKPIFLNIRLLSHGLEKQNSSQIKLIIRLRSGHSFDKKFRAL